MDLVLLAAEPASPVGSGRIVGGWGYVWASYVVTWLTIAGYGLYLWLRRSASTPDGRRE